MASQRKRQPRTRHAPGESSQEQPSHPKEQNKNTNSADQAKGAQNPNKGNDSRKHVHNKQSHTRENRTNQTNVSVADAQDYEPVTYMDAKPKNEAVDTYRKRPIEDRIPLTKREIISNWHTFDGSTLDEEIDQGEDHLLGEDFAEILKLSEFSGSQGGYLHLKGETSWGEISGSEGLGDLRVSDLAAAFATIPFHKQLKIPENMLPANTVAHYIKVADEKRKSYSPNTAVATSTDEINYKMLQTLTLQEPDLPVPTEDQCDSVHGRISALVKPNKCQPITETDIVLQSINKSEDTIPVVPSNIDIYNATMVESAQNRQSKKRTTSHQREADEESEIIDRLITGSKQASTLKNMASKVPPLKDIKPTKSEQKKTSCEDQLEDWLDSILED